MVDRAFTEVELRLMLESATGCHADIEPGRWVIESRLARNWWEVIVEPDDAEEILVIVTAYAVAGQ